jgi:hypothetical protein
MRQQSDAFGMLAWGLRSYAWVVAIFVVALGVAVPALLAQAPDRYEASAQVGPTGRVRLPNLDALPKIATSAFANVYESEAVKRAAGLPPSGNLGSEQIELVAAQDNVIFTVIGHAEGAQEAKGLADTAANALVEELNKYSQALGSYAATTEAPLPDRAEAKVGALAGWALGLAAGVCAGVGAVALILIVRRPVVDATGAEEAADVPFLARMNLHPGQGWGKRADADIRPSPPGMTQLCGRILADETDLLLLVGPENTRRDRYELADELVKWLGRVRRVVPLRTRTEPEAFGTASLASQAGQAGPGGKDLLIIADASPVEVATRPDGSLTLLVVREGIPKSSLWRYSDQYLDGGNAALLLFAKPSKWWRTWARPRPARARSADESAQQRDPAKLGEGVSESQRPLTSAEDEQ